MTFPNNAVSQWTDGLRDKVKSLWHNHTAAQISALLWEQDRVNFSRNAVVGFIHRSGLTVEHKSEVSPMTRNAGHRVPRVDRRIRIVSSKPPRPPKLSAEIIALRCVEISPLNISLVDLEPHHCRYPLGDGPFLFCGLNKTDGSSYCETHFQLCRGIGTGSERAAHKIGAAA
jgi:hypothetical protein